MRRTVILLTVIFLTACGAGPRDPDAVLRPDEMQVDREVLEPGDTVGLEFPQGRVRGLMFALEQEVDGGWEYRYALISTGLDGKATWHSPDAVPAFDRSFEMFAGSERVRIPEEAVPGSWRICTADADENICVRIEVTDG